jgi:chitinase
VALPAGQAAHRRRAARRPGGPAPGTYEQGIEDYSLLAQTCPQTGTVGGPAYAVCRGQWSSTAAGKVTYARNEQLGGVFVWELSGDTADGELIAAIARALR